MTDSRLLVRLSRLNQTAVFLGTAGVVIGALVLPGWLGGVLLLALAAALAGLLTLTWHYHDPRTRVLRVSVLAVLVLLAALRLT
jgi:hypothetical protein